ncbi:MAG: hypothetical protein BA870_01235 [Desulfuromonadales bacterium C00003094]|nr:MAG: hypothetical protein BA870_01235 [Desulfuromonadales bacterium C00003094]OEU76290.1 MAG: hypothetical protein BA869_07835 [Desulfuromonadales bacterium C00003107]
MLKPFWSLRSLFCLLSLCFIVPGQASAEPVVTVTGLVKHHQRLDLADLANYRSLTVRTTEVGSDGAFHGVYRYQGVPLQHLLQAAGVEKEGGEFSKAIDLAIEVRNRQGQRVLLSWAEVAYGRPADVVVAFTAESLLKKGEQLKTQQSVLLPRLVLGNDFYDDRSLEDIVSIEVIDLVPEADSQPVPLASDIQKSTAEVSAKIVWGGARFDGVQHFAGVPLVDVLAQAGLADDYQAVVLVRSRDGYRSLLSYGELFGSSFGRRILLANRMNGQPIGENNEQWLVLPDSSANRYVRDVVAIEILRPRHVPKLTVIGVGPGDTSMITLEALSALARADAVAAPGDIQRRYARYLTGKELLFDPFALAKHDDDTPLSETERVRLRLREEEWRGNADKIRKALDAGRDVAFLDWGDPQIFGSSRWIREYFGEEETETVAGMSSFNAANAVINRDVSANGAIVLTAPKGLRRNEALLEAVAKNGETLAIFMGIHDLPQLVPLLQSHYADATPMRLIYDAGISSREHQVATTLGEVLKVIRGQKERFLGLIYVGPCLASE